MLFWLKKFVSFWFTPLSLCMVGLAYGLWLLRSPEGAKKGRIVAGVAAFLLYAFGNSWISGALLRPLEEPFKPIPELKAPGDLPAPLAACRYIAVLGAGNHYESGYSANNLLWPPSLARVVEGARLAKALPDAKVIVSGIGVSGRESHARVVGRAAIALGIAPERILYLDDARDTEDESRGIAGIAEGNPVALVTSAWHMRRALGLFRGAGIKAVPCPTDFATAERTGVSYADFLWDVQSLAGSSLALRERIGYLWIMLRGKTRADSAGSTPVVR